MQIPMGVTQKMKLYNVYRLCKKYISFFKRNNIEKTTVANTKQIIYRMENWDDFKEKLKIIRKIPVLKNYADTYFDLIPVFIQDQHILEFSESTAAKLNQIKSKLCDRVETIINLYESMNLKESGNGIDIKMPPCEYLDDYISYLQEINFVFTQCPFLQCEGEVLKFESVDVGSNWIKLTLATASTCMILNNAAALIDKALILRSHYVSIQQQEEMLKSIQFKNELTKEQVETYNLLRTTYMNAAISLLENDLGELKNPEERDKAERALEKLADLLDKGCEIYATLDAPEDVQALFPEIQGNLELPDNIINYLEEKDIADK